MLHATARRLQDKEALCHRLADHILVRRGELYVRGMQDDEQQQPEQQQSEQPAQQGAAQQPLKMQDDDPQLLRQVCSRRASQAPQV